MQCRWDLFVPIAVAVSAFFVFVVFPFVVFVVFFVISVPLSHGFHLLDAL